MLSNERMKFGFPEPGSLRGRDEPQQDRSAHDVRGLPVFFEGQARDCERVPDCVAGQPRGGSLCERCR